MRRIIRDPVTVLAAVMVLVMTGLSVLYIVLAS